MYQITVESIALLNVDKIRKGKESVKVYKGSERTINNAEGDSDMCQS